MYGGQCLFIIYYDQTLHSKLLRFVLLVEHNKGVLAIMGRLEEYKTVFLDINFFKLCLTL